ncbi:hypothetical protein [Parvularcula sp. LCG005]|uniref:hypothetical protein n=1 Tax=Parvularcula sp. LCG005 TaxID=3078805 RepID=UPI0029423467|nr:hypothetical protein [Parvularcula sp. LCG005]WOI53079.1 hypothetical protein RUI03_13080 [Parvularcula sp. LCG005]
MKNVLGYMRAVVAWGLLLPVLMACATSTSSSDVDSIFDMSLEDQAVWERQSVERSTALFQLTFLHDEYQKVGHRLNPDTVEKHLTVIIEPSFHRAIAISAFWIRKPGYGYNEGEFDTDAVLYARRLDSNPCADDDFDELEEAFCRDRFKTILWPTEHFNTDVGEDEIAEIFDSIDFKKIFEQQRFVPLDPDSVAYDGTSVSWIAGTESSAHWVTRHSSEAELTADYEVVRPFVLAAAKKIPEIADFITTLDTCVAAYDPGCYDALEKTN